MAKYTDNELLETVQAWHACGENQRTAALALGIAPSTVSLRLATAKARGLMLPKGGQVEAFQSLVEPLPKKGKVNRYLLTSAQNRTKLHMPFWKNLKAMAEHYNARILVSTFRYNKEAFDNIKAAKNRKVEAELAETEYPAEIMEYISNDRIDLAPRLTWAGEVQVMPTARRPLTGFENYTYRKSTIIPHTTIAMQSIAGMKDEGVKLLYTTGCCTLRNYIQRREGFRAEHFHAYAALLVEVNSDGHWWCRQVAQGEDGSLCDLSLTFRGGKLTNASTRVACITWGDIHAAKLDPVVAECGWGQGVDSMLNTLRPYKQHVHDLLDMSVRSHHTRKDPFEVYRNYVHAERGSVSKELSTTASVLSSMTRKWCETVVVNSNHDRHLERFLKEVDWREDMENAPLILQLTLQALQAIREQDKDFHLVEAALRQFGNVQGLVRFLKEDESDIILKHIEGGIECGIHGDRGANGAKGSSRAFATYGRRTNTADKHFAAITDLNYQAGLSGRLDQGYNHGLTSWTPSHTVTYNNGQRTIIGMYAGRYCA